MCFVKRCCVIVTFGAGLINDLPWTGRKICSSPSLIGSFVTLRYLGLYTADASGDDQCPDKATAWEVRRDQQGQHCSGKGSRSEIAASIAASQLGSKFAPILCHKSDLIGRT